MQARNRQSASCRLRREPGHRASDWQAAGAVAAAVFVGAVAAAVAVGAVVAAVFVGAVSVVGAVGAVAASVAVGAAACALAAAVGAVAALAVAVAAAPPRYRTSSARYLKFHLPFVDNPGRLLAPLNDIPAILVLQCNLHKLMKVNAAGE